MREGPDELTNIKIGVFIVCGHGEPAHQRVGRLKWPTWTKLSNRSNFPGKSASRRHFQNRPNTAKPRSKAGFCCIGWRLNLPETSHQAIVLSKHGLIKNETGKGSFKNPLAFTLDNTRHQVFLTFPRFEAGMGLHNFSVPYRGQKPYFCST